MLLRLFFHNWREAQQLWSKATSYEEYRRNGRALLRMYLIVGIVMSALWAQPFRVAYNITSSLDKGFYLVNTWDRTAEVGDIVHVDYRPREWVRARYDGAYIGKDWHFIKHVGAMGGDRLEQDDETIFRCAAGSDECRVLAVRKPTDSRGRPVPDLQFNEVIPTGKLFLTNPHPRSFDSRYHGYFDVADVRGVAYPLFTWPADMTDHEIVPEPVIPDESTVAFKAINRAESLGAGGKN